MELCKSCQKHKATVHQIDVLYGEDGTREVKVFHMCAPCAKAAGVPVPAHVPSYPQIVSVLSKAFLGSKSLVPAGKETACPECGWTLRDFRQTSRFGCPRDYEVFADFVNDLLEQLHGTNEHPASPAEAELGRLTREMNEAVGREDYETAARLRDRVRELEARLERDTASSSEPSSRRAAGQPPLAQGKEE